MKLILRLILIVVATYFLSLYLPWWTVLLVAGLVGFFIPGGGFNVFISGFLGAGLLWMVYAWYLDIETNSILSEKVVQLFPFSDNFMLVVITGFIGALCGGFGAITGNSFRQLFIKKKPKSFYN